MVTGTCYISFRVTVTLLSIPVVLLLMIVTTAPYRPSPVPRTQVVLGHPRGPQLLVPVLSSVFGNVLRLPVASFHAQTDSFEVAA